MGFPSFPLGTLRSKSYAHIAGHSSSYTLYSKLQAGVNIVTQVAGSPVGGVFPGFAACRQFRTKRTDGQQRSQWVN